MKAQSSEAGIHPAAYRLPSAAQIGRVRLAVSHLDRSIAFYTTVIGLVVLSRNEQEHVAHLGVAGSDEVLLELQQLPGVQGLKNGGRIGLYHTAFLLPSRSALANFVLHLRSTGVPFASSDHLVSEALYLTDPDGLQVEVYADRPREQWTVEDGELLMGVLPLRFHELLPLASDRWSGAPLGTSMGHLHFFVGDLIRAKKFYHGALGLDIMAWRYPGALFTSAGGYHHHVGLNIWAAASPAASAHDARLLFWELLLPSDQDVEEVKASFAREGYSAERDGFAKPLFSDPWGIRVELSSEEAKSEHSA
jgi:catechol 2,3-dioxygenase